MHTSQDFLVEIGTEELPPKELQPLVNSFAESICKQLTASGVSFATHTTFATPRRLAVFIKDVATQQPQQIVSKRGPAVTAAYNVDGTPTKAALGFASSCGVTMQQLSKQETDKGVWLYFEQTVAGKKTIELLPEIVSKALTQLPVKKYMRWGAGELSFVRPVHWVVMLLGKEVVPATIFGINASNLSYGHRIHAPHAIKISSPEKYAQQLEQDGKIIADFELRKQQILTSIQEIAKNEQATAVIDFGLLDMVTGLVEHPVALLANFNPEFLRVPKECLISSMQDHQKCFALLDSNGKLLPKFILISNLSSSDPATVVRGNELVMHARLADAAFYYDKDQQQSLESRVDQLKTVIYQKQLGSIYDKTIRIQNLATHIAEQINADVSATQRAAYLCKADLLTNMVYEFPELQGIMGSYYAQHDGENDDVSVAIAQHYWPRFASDLLPETDEGLCIALADRIDTLVGFFGIGIVPTGEKDPYALRRQALAVLRILFDPHTTKLDLVDLIAFAHKQYTGKIQDASAQLLEFFVDRLKSLALQDNKATANTFAAVTAIGWTNPAQFAKRIEAVTHFLTLPAAETLAAANKRVKNILDKNAIKLDIATAIVDENLLSEPAEKQLYTALQEQELFIKPMLASWQFSEILQSLSTLQYPVDNFFTHVMVMVDDQAIRNNRLHLLYRLRNLFLQVADVSLL